LERLRLFKDEQLIKLLLEHSFTNLSYYAIDILVSRNSSIALFADSLHSQVKNENDPSNTAAVVALACFAQQIDEQNLIQQRYVGQRKTQPYIFREKNGFLCDRPDLFKDTQSSENLLSEVAKTLEKEEELEYAEKLLADGNLHKKIPRFIVPKKRRDDWM
jgi:hypothetical protein